MDQEQLDQERLNRRRKALEEYNNIVSYDISSGLQAQEQKKKKRKRRILRFRNVAFAVIIIFTAACYFYIGKQLTEKDTANKALRRELSQNLEKTELLEQELNARQEESGVSAATETEIKPETAAPDEQKSDGSTDFTAVYPLTGSSIILQSFGSSQTEDGSTVFFPGLEMGTDADTSVIAAAEGTVVFAGEDSDTGLTVRIDHGNGYLSYYCFNRKIMVVPGQTVTTGQVIALPGEPDSQDISHMEFRIMNNGSYINPEDVLEIKG